MADDELRPILDAAGVEAAHIDPDALGDLAAKVTGRGPAEVILYAARAPGLTADGEPTRPPDYFEIHDREWWIDARRPDGRKFLVDLLTAAAVADALGLDHTLSWIATVLPATLTVTGVRADDRGVHFAVRRHPSPELPADLADDINAQDFADFVAALSRAARVLPLSPGGSVTFSSHPPRSTPR